MKIKPIQYPIDLQEYPYLAVEIALKKNKDMKLHVALQKKRSREKTNLDLSTLELGRLDFLHCKNNSSDYIEA